MSGIKNNINFQKRVSEETIQELENRSTTINQEVKALGEKRESLSIQITEGESDLKSITGKIVKEKSITDLKQSAVNDTYQSMEKMQDMIRSEQQSKEAYLEELKTNELKIVEMKNFNSIGA